MISRTACCLTWIALVGTVLMGTALVTTVPSEAEDSAKPLSPVEARGKVGQEVTVQMVVQTAKNRLEKRGEIYLDAEPDFRDPKNFAVVVTRAGAALYATAGIADPAEHFLQKTIRATGVVKVVDEVPRIEVDDLKQVEIVEPGK
jgi:hypothetical protein